MKLLLKVFFLFLCTACVHQSSGQTHSSKNEIINWNSPEGMKRLSESKYRADFFKLANHFEPQSNKIFCGPATATIILNSLRVRTGKTIPKDETLLSKKDMKYLSRSPFYERYTQNNVFLKSSKSKLEVLGQPNKKTKKADWGFQVRQFSNLFKSHGVRSVLRVANKKLNIATIRAEIANNLATPNNYVAVNYSQKVMNQPGGGHISPLGAYHQPTDSVLIMDVTPNKADWVWVKLSKLIQAMATKDTIENRGYVLVGP